MKMFDKLDKDIEEFIRSIFLEKLDESEHIFINSKIIKSWKQDDNYVLVFENMRPNCISYLLEKKHFEIEIRKRKINKLIKNDK